MVRKKQPKETKTIKFEASFEVVEKLEEICLKTRRHKSAVYLDCLIAGIEVELTKLNQPK